MASWVLAEMFVVSYASQQHANLKSSLFTMEVKTKKETVVLRINGNTCSIIIVYFSKVRCCETIVCSRKYRI